MMSGTFKDLTGKRFGKLTVIERAENKGSGHNTKAQWKCICDCGNEKIVPACMLNNGHTTSCGCARIKDLIGKKFGELTVIEMAGRRIQPNGSIVILWKCICDCGCETIVNSGNLSSGHTKNCGHSSCSAQEAVIRHKLIELNIPHKKEVWFDDFRANTGRAFRFDFGLYNENGLIALIEYQGPQHYIETEGFEFYGAGQREYSDELKKKYCADKNIPLYEIKYTENTIDKLTEILQKVYGNTVLSPEKEKCND